MAEIDPRVRRIRRIGVGIFLAVAVVAVPLGMHIQSTWRSPELGLTLLGAVLLLVLISLFAMETAVTPIPERRYTEEDAAGLDLDPTEMADPESHPTKLANPEAQAEPEADLAGLSTELDLEGQTTANPDGPMLLVPHPSLAHAETRLADTELDEDELT